MGHKTISGPDRAKLTLWLANQTTNSDLYNCGYKNLAEVASTELSIENLTERTVGNLVRHMGLQDTFAVRAAPEHPSTTLWADLDTTIELLEETRNEFALFRRVVNEELYSARNRIKTLAKELIEVRQLIGPNKTPSALTDILASH